METVVAGVRFDGSARGAGLRPAPLTRLGSEGSRVGAGTFARGAGRVSIVAHTDVKGWRLSHAAFGKLFGATRADVERTGHKLAYIRSVSSFSHLPAPTILVTAQLMRHEHFSPGEPVFSVGDWGDRFYVIEEGEAEVHIPSKKEAELKVATAASPATVASPGKPPHPPLRTESSATVDTSVSSGDVHASETANTGGEMATAKGLAGEGAAPRKLAQGRKGRSSFRQRANEGLPASRPAAIEAINESPPTASPQRRHSLESEPVRSSRPSMIESPGGGGASATPVKKIPPGQCFGEIALFNDVPRTASVVAGPRGLGCWSLAREEFREIFVGGDREIRDASVEQLVLFTGPGGNADKEMALVLARALSDMQLIELRGVIVGTAPAYDRARLARATLDELDLRQVPVGVGTESTLPPLQTLPLEVAVTATHSSAPASFLKGVSYLKRKPDKASGQELLRQLFVTAQPASLTLVVCTSYTDLALFMRENEQLFGDKTARVAIMGDADATSLAPPPS